MSKAQTGMGFPKTARTELMTPTAERGGGDVYDPPLRGFFCAPSVPERSAYGKYLASVGFVDGARADRRHLLAICGDFCGAVRNRRWGCRGEHRGAAAHGLDQLYRELRGHRAHLSRWNRHRSTCRQA